jgi:hypothetical protein
VINGEVFDSAEVNMLIEFSNYDKLSVHDMLVTQACMLLVNMGTPSMIKKVFTEHKKVLEEHDKRK